MKWRKPHTHTANTDVVNTKLLSSAHIHPYIHTHTVHTVQRQTETIVVYIRCIYSPAYLAGVVYLHMNTHTEKKMLNS